MNNYGIYVHVPFCRSKCPYCDFYSQRGSFELTAEYAKAVEKEICDYKGVSADTLYFGGGTPSFINPQFTADMTNCAKENFIFSENPEITIECNPSDDIETAAKIYAACGINRVSLGLQSAVENERKRLGRMSSKERVKEVVKAVKNAGIENISLDIMLGIPGQTKDSLSKTLEFVLSNDIKHVSAYMLQIEENTWFYNNLSKLSLPDEEITAELYLYACNVLAENGIMQYEISNFAVPGFESRHNLKYWNCEEYLGFGPAAYSYSKGRRYHYERDIEKYIKSSEKVDDGAGGDEEEKEMLLLRLVKGIDNPTDEMRKRAENLGEYCISDERGVRLTKKGFLVSNNVIFQLINH